VKNRRIRKIILTLAFIYGSLFPKSGVIASDKTLEEMEECDEIHLGI
jgi:hypothetical protein